MQFQAAIQKAHNAVRDRSHVVHPSHWQATDVSKMPEAATHEVLNYILQAQIWTEDLDLLRKDIKPNLPWADDHFLERVSGEALNPGVQWAKWPWGNKADKSRHVRMKKPNAEYLGFSHTYMERYWPNNAGAYDVIGVDGNNHLGIDELPRKGIRYDYGNLNDVVEMLRQQPLTRQAYLPVWFPEDTGNTKVRLPCTLGYHFLMRYGFLHVTYYIRSCDIYRHMADDIYLTVRLLLWVLNQLREPMRGSPNEWDAVKPGMFNMNIVSLHCFKNDYIKLYGAPK